MKSNILVIGGTGKTGRKVAKGLQDQGHNVRIGSRSADPAFDWQDPSNWATALDGMDKVYVTFQPDLAIPGALEAIEELVKQSKNAGIKKIVLLSGKGEKEAELCEQVIIHSGIDFTILRCSWFNQNFSESFFLDAILSGQIALPKPEALVPYVDTDDIAEMAIEVLNNDQHNDKLYQLTGPKGLTFPEVIKEIANRTQRDLEFIPISISEYIETLRQHQVPEDYIWLINYLFSNVLDAEGNNEISHDIEKVLGRKPKNFSQYVDETVSSGVWNPAT